MKKQYQMLRPDNWHAHLRQDELLSLVAPYLNPYGRVMCMGNTTPMIETADQAFVYRDKIVAEKVRFEPVMCIMITQFTTPAIIREAARRGIKFVKFMPIGSTTGAVRGLRLDDFQDLDPLFRAIVEEGMFLLIHAELPTIRNGGAVPFLKREELTIEFLKYYLLEYPELKITIEHPSTAKMIHFIESRPSRINIGGTPTIMHATMTYDQVFAENPWVPTNVYNFCLPILKPEADRQAVNRAMTSGNPRFYAGTDMATHYKWQKESENRPAGITFGTTEIPRYFEIFAKAGKLHMAEAFLSRFGAERYGFPLNKDFITIVEEEWIAPEEENGIRFCGGGETLQFRVLDEGN